MRASLTGVVGVILHRPQTLQALQAAGPVVAATVIGAATTASRIVVFTSHIAAIVIVSIDSTTAVRVIVAIAVIGIAIGVAIGVAIGIVAEIEPIAVPSERNTSEGQQCECQAGIRRA